MNIRYASAATFVSPMTIATSFAPPTSASSSVSIKFVSPYTTASVPTTFSFAIKPVIAAAASCHTPNPRGIRSTANGDAIDARIEVCSIPSSTTWNCQLKLCMICTTVLHTKIIVPAFTMYALPRESMESVARFRLGILYSGSSIIKKDLRYLYPVIFFTSNAPRKISRIPTRYMVGPTHEASAKNAPANNAITGSFAPQGMNGVSIAVALLSLSLRIVRQAIIPGIAHPVPITIGMTDFPESPTLLKIGSRTTVARAIYPQSSKRAIRKYITITSGRKPTTAPTPPMIPSTRRA